MARAGRALKVAITGVSGLLGANVAAAAIAAGHEVVGTRRAGSRADAVDDLVGSGAFRWAEAPLDDGDALARAFDGCGWVVHCAAATSVLPKPTPALIAANVEGTRAVVDAVRRAGVARLVHTSSTVTVGLSDDGAPCDEHARWNLPEHGLDDGYATTKRDAELLVGDAVARGEVDAVIVNPAFLLGPRDARPSSGQMILEVAAGRAVIASPGRNCFVDARDVAAGVLLAAERGVRGQRYILGGENLTYGEVFARIAAVVGARGPRGTAPWAVARMAGLAGDLAQWWTGREQAVTSITVRWGFAPGFVFSSDKARAELGWTAGPLDDGIRAAWQWFRDHGR